MGGGNSRREDAFLSAERSVVFDQLGHVGKLG